MNTIIVQTSKNVTLIGAGETSKDQMALALGFAPYLVAADGGAELALKYGRTPNYVIGDFDSIDTAILQKFPENRRHHIGDQNSTDFDKCLAAIDAPLIVAVGFVGGRLDHQLTAFSALVRHAGRRCVLLGERDLILALHEPLELALAPGSRLSLFPMLPTRGTSDGLDWPVEGLEFAPGGQIGTSNRVADGRVRLEFIDPGMLLILPLAALGAVVAAYAG